METAQQDNETFSIFGQMTFALSDKTDITVGLNYLQDDKQISLTQANSDVFSQLDLAGADGVTALTNLAYSGGFFATLGIPPITAVPQEGLPAYMQTVAATAGGIAPTANNPFLAFQALQFLPQMLGIPNAAEPGTSDDSKTTYTVSLSHAFSDDLNMYATYATGYKATSWNLSRDTRPTQEEYNSLVASGTSLPNNLALGTR